MSKKILYLYAEVMGYTLATMNALQKNGMEVHVIHWDHKKLSKFQIDESTRVNFYPKSKLDRKKILDIAEKIRPDVIVISGWMDRDYLSVAKLMKSRGVKIVMALDGQWRGTVKNYILSGLGFLGVLGQYFSFAWVAGVYQYEYARRIGFLRKNIIFDLYSADLELFDKGYEKVIREKSRNYPRKFLFVGRLEREKGLDDLIAAWKSMKQDRRDWHLVLIGDGSLRANFETLDGVSVYPFMQPPKLIECLKDFGCFVLPSKFEPWGVVVHEFAAAGFPLILSTDVGAAKTFLINNGNGFTFRRNSPEQLAVAMRKIINKTDSELINMGIISRGLSRKITPDTSAMNLISIM